MTTRRDRFLRPNRYDHLDRRVQKITPEATHTYSTKYFDAETGFYYYGYRYYSPALMRWLTRDPIGEAGGVNLYLAMGNSPDFRIDALGQKAITSQHSLSFDTSSWNQGGRYELHPLDKSKFKWED